MNTDIDTILKSPEVRKLYTLELKDGIKVTQGTTEVVLRTVRFRDISYTDETVATAAAERLVHIQGVPQLLLSNAAFKTALNFQYIESIGGPALTLGRGEFTMEMVGRIHPLEWQVIESRVYVLELAAQLRYGQIDPAQFKRWLAGEMPAQAPQPVGQAEDQGAAPSQSVPGPAVLTDLTDTRAPGAA